MRQFGKWTIGGLQHKIFNLCVMLVIGAIVAFAIVGVLQLRTLGKLAADTGESTSSVIKEKSTETLKHITEEHLIQSITIAADRADDEFWIMEHDFTTLAAQVEDVFRHPENYGEIDVFPPQKKNAGKYVLQLMYAEDTPQDDPENIKIIRKLANLAPHMAEIVRGNENYTMDCYIALPNGTTLAMDKMSDQKYLEDGTIRPYDPTSRAWYKGAVEKGSIYFSEAVHSYFYDLTEVVFGVPVYVDGKLVAVLEGSTKLDDLQRMVSEISIGENGFSILLSAEGQIVFSPMKEGDLAMDDMLSTDIRDTENEALKSLVDKALTGTIGFEEVDVDGETYYAAYAPLQTLGWVQMMFVPASQLEEPADMLIAEVDRVTQETRESYNSNFKQSSVLALIVVVLLITNAILVAIAFSNRILNPINVLTKKIEELSQDNFVFEMADVYRTGDEIEVLAEKFDGLSKTTRNYIREIMEVTAEKERIGAELSVASRIQADMLPNEFPMFPDRKEFDLYASMVPAKEVSGDFYDIFLIDEDHLCMVMADVAGKGVPAALFMVNAKNLIKSRALSGGTPSEILTDVNLHLCEGNKAKMFVTVWLGILTISTGEVIECNAGHENPAIRKAGGDFEYITRKHGLVMGIMKRGKYVDDSFMLQPGDTLFIYTDGVPEATDDTGERFYNDRMLEALDQAKELSAKELCDSVRSRVDKFVGDAPKFDDMTMLAISYSGMRDI